MRVAMLSPISWRTPPRHYGPWENVVSLLTESLVGKGVDVTLFATADSYTAGKLAAICPRAYSEDATLDPKVWECLHISELFERAGEFDLIHNQYDFLPLTYSSLVSTPIVTTIHGFSSENILPVFNKYNGKTAYVAISEADKHPSLDYIRVIHHGIDLTQFTFSDSDDGYLVFFGRIHHDKGTAEAIEVARRTGRKLVIAGIVQDEEYFRKRIEPHIDGDKVSYFGPVGPDKRSEVLGRAAALLHIINFDEPFGLSMVESMACGTPVVATGRGAVPEVVDDKVSGFVVDDLEGAVMAVKRIGDVDRLACRRHVEERFTVERMAEEYLAVYKRILGGRRRPDSTTDREGMR